MKLFFGLIFAVNFLKVHGPNSSEPLVESVDRWTNSTKSAQKVVYIAILIEEERLPEKAPENGSQAWKIVLTEKSAFSIFNMAVSAEKRRLTSLTNLDGSKLIRNVHHNLEFEIQPIFIQAGPSDTMLAELTDRLGDDWLLNENRGNRRLGAVLEISECSPKHCDETFEMAEMLPENLAVFTTCCFYEQYEDPVGLKGIGPKVIYDALEPDALIDLTYTIARKFRWRRFHFVISPFSSSQDAFFKIFNQHMAKRAEVEHLDFGDLIVTKSFFCSEYLAKNKMCDLHQAQRIVLREATATFMLLDTKEDLPYVQKAPFEFHQSELEFYFSRKNQNRSNATLLLYFITRTLIGRIQIKRSFYKSFFPNRHFLKDISEINSDDRYLVDGKAIIIVNQRGVLRQTYDELIIDAPPGIFVFMQDRYDGIEFEGAKVDNLHSVGIDALLYSESRILAKAVESFERSEGQFKRISDLFCSTKYQFKGASSWLGYSKPCHRHYVTYDILNVKEDSNGKKFLENVFYFRDSKLIQVGTPFWFGSDWEHPYEDFCKLDNADCPVVRDFTVITTLSSIGCIIFIVLLIVGFFFLRRRRRKQKIDEEHFQEMVIIDYDEIKFDDIFFQSKSINENSKFQDLRSKGLSIFTDVNEDGSISDGESVNNKKKKKDNGRTKAQSKRNRQGSGTTMALARAMEPKMANPEYIQSELLEALAKLMNDTDADGNLRRRWPLSKKTYGKSVTRAIYRGEQVFVKSFQKGEFIVTSEMLSELIQVHNLHHQNINAFIGLTANPGKICTVQAFCSKGTLATLLSSDSLRDIDRTFKLGFIRDIAQGMLYLHQSPVHSHGHLTSDNVIVDSRWVCKITNIPLSASGELEAVKDGEGTTALQSRRSSASSYNSEGESNASGMKSRTSITAKFLVKTVATPKDVTHLAVSGIPKRHFDEDRDFYYMAPEILRMAKDERPLRGTQEGDVYSYGIICYEVLTRLKAFQNTNLLPVEIFEKLIYPVLGAPDFRPVMRVGDVKTIEEVEIIASSCWDEQAHMRPEFVEIVDVIKDINMGKDDNVIDKIILILEDRASELENNLQVKMNELIDERKKKKELISKWLPHDVAESFVYNHGSPIAQHFFSATILASEITNLSQIVSLSSPSEVVQLLDDFGQQIDALLEKKDVVCFLNTSTKFRIASGVNEPYDQEHAYEITQIALDLHQVVNEFKITHIEDMKVQVKSAIQSGKVSTFLVGNKVPRFNLYGDALVSLEFLFSQVEPGKILLSQETKQLLNDDFEIAVFKTDTCHAFELVGQGNAAGLKLATFRFN